MILLVLSVVLSFVSLHHSALVEDPPDLQLNRYHPKIIILSELLAKECPEFIRWKKDIADIHQFNPELQAVYLQHLEQQLVKCRQEKFLSTTSRNTAVTDAVQLCPSYDGDSVFNVQFISYNNPTNDQAPGVLCRTDRSPCNISLKICVSAINSTNCEFYDRVVNVVGEKSQTGISDTFGNLTSPVSIHLGNRTWQGAHVHMTVLEKNLSNNLKVDHKTEGFSYDVTDVQGSRPRLITLYEKHATNKTRLMLKIAVPCPSSSAALPTTPTSTVPTTPTTTLPTTTTTPPVPAECLTATNLMQSWRRDYFGRNIRPGEPHSLHGWACDLYHNKWFRFSGNAGTHMLDKCPKWLSCGTYAPHWTDNTPPQAVGVPAKISAYQVYRGNCKFRSLPMQVMRCSLGTDHDLIYKYTGRFYSPCDGGFCGMK